MSRIPTDLKWLSTAYSRYDLGIAGPNPNDKAQ